jgi:hypothetical protein
MSIGTILIVVFAVAMIAMHLRGHGSHGGGQGGHGGGHGGGCGGGHGNSEATGTPTATVRASEDVDPASESDLHRGHQRR